MNYRKEYIKQLKTLKNQIKIYKKDIDEAERRLACELKEVPQRKFAIDQTKRYIFGLRYSLYKFERELEFLRVPTQEDIEYRLDIQKNFSFFLERAFINKVDLRFHGTSIYFAKEILASGEISCSEDRLGFSTSFDFKGRFSVSPIGSVDVTISYYLDLTNFFMPAGCLFVMKSRGEDDVLDGSQMRKFVFKETPEALVGILTTPENIDRVKGWCVDAGIDEDLVSRFEDFLQKDFTI